jgi:ankyrin repeat protein
LEQEVVDKSERATYRLLCIFQADGPFLPQDIKMIILCMSNQITHDIQNILGAESSWQGFYRKINTLYQVFPADLVPNLVKNYFGDIPISLFINKGEGGRTFLHSACDNSDFLVIKYFFQIFNDNVEQVLATQCNSGNTPLHYLLCDANFKRNQGDTEAEKVCADVFELIVVSLYENKERCKNALELFTIKNAYDSSIVDFVEKHQNQDRTQLKQIVHKAKKALEEAERRPAKIVLQASPLLDIEIYKLCKSFLPKEIAWQIAMIARTMSDAVCNGLVFCNFGKLYPYDLEPIILKLIQQHSSDNAAEILNNCFYYHGKQLYEIRNDFGQTAFNLACGMSHLLVVKTMLLMSKDNVVKLLEVTLGNEEDKRTELHNIVINIIKGKCDHQMLDLCLRSLCQYASNSEQIKREVLGLLQKTDGMGRTALDLAKINSKILTNVRSEIKQVKRLLKEAEKEVSKKEEKLNEGKQEKCALQ